MIDGLASPFEYRFLGDHPLSGRRTSTVTIDLWWQRIFRLLPNGKFTIHQIVVQGNPFKTRIAVRSTISAALASGDGYSNDVMQFRRLRLGKLTRIETMEDTAKFERYLTTLDPATHPDAIAPPIND